MKEGEGEKGTTCLWRALETGKKERGGEKDCKEDEQEEERGKKRLHVGGLF